MASTKRRRTTKHRGNAAGVVETRGRTGRKPTSSERKADAKAARANRFDSPPSWSSALKRAVIAVGIFIAVVLFVFRQNVAAAISLSAFMLVLYVPLGYYTDLWLYRRRQRQKAEGKV